MQIITVQFAAGAKTYDYLLLNPRGCKINASQPLKYITGCDHRGMRYQQLTVVQQRSVTVLPSWVTSEIVLQGKNEVIIQKIINPKTPTETTVITKKVAVKPKKQRTAKQHTRPTVFRGEIKSNGPDYKFPWDEWLKQL